MRPKKRIRVKDKVAQEYLIGDCVGLASDASVFGNSATIIGLDSTRAYPIQIEWSWWAKGWIKKESIIRKYK